MRDIKQSKSWEYEDLYSKRNHGGDPTGHRDFLRRDFLRRQKQLIKKTEKWQERTNENRDSTFGLISASDTLKGKELIEQNEQWLTETPDWSEKFDCAGQAEKNRPKRSLDGLVVESDKQVEVTDSQAVRQHDGFKEQIEEKLGYSKDQIDEYLSKAIQDFNNNKNLYERYNAQRRQLNKILEQKKKYVEEDISQYLRENNREHTKIQNYLNTMGQELYKNYQIFYEKYEKFSEKYQEGCFLLETFDAGQQLFNTGRQIFDVRRRIFKARGLELVNLQEKVKIKNEGLGGLEEMLNVEEKELHNRVEIAEYARHVLSSEQRVLALGETKLARDEEQLGSTNNEDLKRKQDFLQKKRKGHNKEKETFVEFIETISKGNKEIKESIASNKEQYKIHERDVDEFNRNSRNAWQEIYSQYLENELHIRLFKNIQYSTIAFAPERERRLVLQALLEATSPSRVGEESSDEEPLRRPESPESAT